MPDREIKVNRLVDRFGRVHTYLRISVTDRCNLRCVYCMPAAGIEWRRREEILTLEEIFRVVRIFADWGVDKIRITGGEPLIRHDLEILIEQLASLSPIQTIAITTNAVLLKDKAKMLRESGISALNISLDTFRKERFAQISKRGEEFDNVMAGIEAALSVGFPSIKLNSVIMANVNEDELLDFVNFTRDKPINVRFIEYMPFRNNQWSHAGFIPYTRMKQIIEQQYELIPIVNKPSAVAKDFCISGFTGTVSFITSMSDSFCGSCNRIRLTADGSIKSCLFHPADVNIREALRSGITDTKLADVIQGVILLKPEAHPPMEELVAVDNSPMIQIGG